MAGTGNGRVSGRGRGTPYRAALIGLGRIADTIDDEQVGSGWLYPFSHMGSYSEVSQVVDAVLSGVFVGDLAVALERAAAFCRVLATGAALDADLVDEGDGDAAARITRGASGLVRTAEDLEHAAGLWRTGVLD